METTRFDDFCGVAGFDLIRGADEWSSPKSGFFRLDVDARLVVDLAN